MWLDTLDNATEALYNTINDVTNPFYLVRPFFTSATVIMRCKARAYNYATCLTTLWTVLIVAVASVIPVYNILSGQDDWRR